MKVKETRLERNERIRRANQERLSQPRTNGFVMLGSVMSPRRPVEPGWCEFCGSGPECIVCRRGLSPYPV